MIKEEFWEKVADVWSKKEVIEIPPVEEISIPDELDDDEEEIDFDDWDEADDFFDDILNGE
jgi:hypothetical protein